MNRPPTAFVLVIQYAILVLASIFAFYPVWFAILASGRLGNQLYSMSLPAMFVPANWTFENYRAMLFGGRPVSWNYSNPEGQSGSIDNIRGSSSSLEMSSVVR